MLINIKKSFTLLLSIIFLSGCATALNKQAYNKEASTHIKTISIAERPDAETYDAFINAHPGNNFGLIGALIAAADMEAKSTRLTAAINPNETKLQKRILEQITKGLNTLGYETETIQVSEKLDDEQVLTELKTKSNRDATMVVSIKGRYVAAGTSAPYVPYLYAHVKTTERETGNILYEDYFTYGFLFPYSTQPVHTHLPEGSEYRFDTADAFEANPILARDGLTSGLQHISDQVVADLQRD